jgi:hypothetical protein
MQHDATSHALDQLPTLPPAPSHPNYGYAFVNLNDGFVHGARSLASEAVTDLHNVKKSQDLGKGKITVSLFFKSVVLCSYYIIYCSTPYLV